MNIGLLNRREFLCLPALLPGEQDDYNIKRLTHDVAELTRRFEEVEMKQGKLREGEEILANAILELINSNNITVQAMRKVVAKVDELEQAVLTMNSGNRQA